MTENKKTDFRQIATVERFLKDTEIQKFNLNTHVTTEAIRMYLEQLRKEILSTADEQGLGELVDYKRIIQEVVNKLTQKRFSSYRRVINATGVVLHTGLGRAVL